MKEFAGKVAVITGAASEIGLSIAKRCVREGMKVVLADLDGANLTNAETEMSSMLRHGPLRYSNLAHLDIDILPHRAGIRFGRPGGSEAWRRP